jgi:hypothetical protein
MMNNSDEREFVSLKDALGLPDPEIVREIALSPGQLQLETLDG